MYTSIDFDKIINSPDLGAIVKLTAIQIKKNPYMSLGDFFKGLSNTDLTVLNLMYEMVTQEQDVAYMDDLIVLCEILSRAEGIEVTDAADATENINYFGMLCAAVSLHRRGMVEVIWENLTLGRDMDEKDIVRLKQ